MTKRIIEHMSLDELRAYAHKQKAHIARLTAMLLEALTSEEDALEAGNGDLDFLDEPETADPPTVHERAKAIRRKQSPVVYFVASEELIKIGWSRRFNRRLGSLQRFSAKPIKLVALIQDEKAVRIERAIHAELASRRRHGEWFDISPEEAIQCAIRHGGAAKSA